MADRSRGQLAHPCARAYRHEVRHVDAADQQYDEHATPEQQQRSARFRNQLLLERPRSGAEADVRQDLLPLRERVEVALVQRIELRLHLLNRAALAQPPQLLPSIVVTLIVSALLWRERGRRPQRYLGVEEPERFGHDAQNRIHLAIDPQILADRVVATAKGFVPETVTQEDFAIVAGLGFALGEHRSAVGGHPEHVEERRRRSHARDPLGVAVTVTTERRAVFTVHRQRLQRREVTQAVEVVRNRIGRLFDARAGIGVVHLHELRRLVERQRPQDDRVDDGEDGRVGADAQGQCRDRCGGERTVSPQQAEREPQVLEQAIHAEGYERGGMPVPHRRGRLQPALRSA